MLFLQYIQMLLRTSVLPQASSLLLKKLYASLYDWRYIESTPPTVSGGVLLKYKEDTSKNPYIHYITCY